MKSTHAKSKSESKSEPVSPSSTADHTRRDVLKHSGAAALAATTIASIAPVAYAQASDSIRIGLIGCGGRGTGAALDNLRANQGTEVVAMADAFAPQLQQSHETMLNANVDAARIKVTEEDKYVGIEGAYELIARDDVDLIIHATPPGYRPDHTLAAVQAGKHLFIEKPTCVDPAGYRKNIAAGVLAKANGTAIVTGTLYRRTPNFVEAIAKIHDGEIGQIVSGEAYYMAGGLWQKPREDGMTDMEDASRNWLYHVFMSGDLLVEQSMHNIDVINWIMGGAPVKAYGSGGRAQRTDAIYGNVYDHFSIGYDYENGAHVDFKGRQQIGTLTRVQNFVKGTLGHGQISPGLSTLYAYEGNARLHGQRAGYEGYQVEHKELIDSIRAGEPIVEIEQTADSSLTAVMGRLAAYSGQEVTFEQAKTMDLDLWVTRDGAPVTRDTPVTYRDVAIPGQYELPGAIA